MQSIVNVPTSAPRGTYPYIGQLKAGHRGNTAGIQRYVLFTGPRQGVQIGGNVDRIGYSTSWVEDAFEPVPAGTTVTITV